MTSPHRERERAVEHRAAAAAAFILNAKARRIDAHGRQKTRDFDLVFEDRHIEPLEVTQYAHEPTRVTQARLDPDGYDADLDRQWWVSIPYFERDDAGIERPYDV